MVKGYAGCYVGYYNDSAQPQFSVGEYWDSQSNIEGWMRETGRPYSMDQNADKPTFSGDGNANFTPKSAAFDFGLKYVINDVFNGNNINVARLNQYGSLSFTGDPRYNRWSVTFVDNHDTYRDSRLSKSEHELAANAFILTLPGTPCIFWPHWVGHKQALKAMIAARKEAGVTNQSQILWSGIYPSGPTNYDRCYQICVQGTNHKLLLRLGNTDGMAEPYGYRNIWHGDSNNWNFSLYISTDVQPVEQEFTVTFEKPANWSTPHCYVWTGTGEGSTLYTGAWPGVEMKQYLGNTYKLKFYGVGMPSNIQFNDGTNQQQSADLNFVNGGNFKIGDYQYQAVNTSNYVFFEKPNDWGNQIYCHAWVEGGQDLTVWPGASMTNVGNNVYKYEFTGNVLPTKIIFNAGSDYQKSANLDFVNGGHYSFGNNNNEYGCYNWNNTSENFIFVEDTKGWGQVYCWAWNESTNLTGGTWPGAAMEKWGSSNIYRLKFTEGLPTKLVFSNGIQTRSEEPSKTTDLDFINGGLYTLGDINYAEVSTPTPDFVEEACYSRYFTAENIATLCLPVDVTYTELLGVDGRLYCMSDYDSDGNIYFVRANSIEAGKPYVFVANSDGAKFQSVLQGKELMTLTPIPVTINNLTFTGTMEEISLVSDQNTTFYGYQNNKFVRVGTNNGAKLLPYRAYFSLPTPQASNSAPAAIIIDDEVSGIVEVEADAVRSATGIYTISGVKVADMSQPGIYIVNGKKVIKK